MKILPAHLILITGIPGTGKTTVANYLALKHDFTHYDREDFSNWSSELTHLWRASLRTFVLTATLANPKIVISWGFLPGEDDADIQLLINMGFKMFWFDGDRTAARRTFLQRGTVPEQLFREQMERINAMQLSKFKHTKINAFKDGEIRPVAEVAEEVLKAA